MLMKCYLKNALKSGILIFGISIFLWNCQKEDDNQPDSDLLNKNKSISNVSLDDMLNQNSFSKKALGLGSKNKASFSKKGTNEPSYILTSSKGLKYVIEEGNNYYVFPMKRTDQKDEYFYNFVVHDHDGELEKYIYKYPLDETKDIMISPITYNGNKSGNNSISARPPGDVLVGDETDLGGGCSEITIYRVTPCPCVGHTDPDICFCPVQPIRTYVSGPVPVCYTPPVNEPEIEEPVIDEENNQPDGGPILLPLPTNPDKGSNPTPPIINPAPLDITNSLDLTNLQRYWLDLLANQNFKTEVSDYLNGFTKPSPAFDAALLFVQQAISIVIEFPNVKFERLSELNELLKDNPWALIQDCAQQNGLNTVNYIDLYEQTIPQECSDRLFNLGTAFHHQPITDGNVPLANIDYYGVEITSTPDFNNDGTPDSEAEMYEAFRNNFINLASGEVDDFQFSCDSNFDGDINTDDRGDISWDFIPLSNRDGINFVSNNPIASILLIEADASGLLPWIATDDGAVMVSHFTNNDWTIASIQTANNGTQPFSGNRQWGWNINQNGNFEFFTRAVDVANISKLLNIGANTECQQETYYDIAEATWENLQQEIALWVNNNGGQASIVPKTVVRVAKEKVEELLNSNETINQINCN